MKQTKLLLATIAMLWCSLTASAHHFAVGGIYYSFESETDLTVKVTYQGSYYNEYSNEYSGAVTIPSAVTYNGRTYRVTSIGTSAFWECTSLTAITIPEGVTSIGNGAFSYCSSLTSITIPESVTSIGSSAFSGCTSLTAITLPESVTSIGTSAFWECTSLTAITIPEGVTSIGYGVFRDCTSLTAITIPEGVTSIEDYAFYGCSSLTAITIPESVTSIGRDAFSYCSSLTAITIPESSQLTSIGYKAFCGCSSLTAITIPESVTSIGSSVFWGCGGELTINCNIPSYSQSSYGVFYESNFTKVTIGESVTSIGNYAFNECSSLKELVIEDGSETLSLGYNFSSYYGNEGLFYDCPLETVYLGRNLRYSSGSAGYSPFYKQEALTSVTIGEGVTSIGDGAFYGCSSLTAITIPEGVTSIGSSAFYNCTSLTAITIPESVTSIGREAFDGCSSLTSITIPEGVKSIGNDAFYNCIRLYTVINCSNLGISKGSTAYGYVAYYAKKVLNGNNLSTVGDYQFYTSNGVHYLANYSGNDSDLILPDSYNGENYKIADYAFYGCSSLTAITIPEGVTGIGDGAFDGCSSLTAITIPEGVTSIEESAFYNCTSLTAITIPESVTSIGDYAFSGCTSLTAITIPEGVTSIGSSAFSRCSSLTSITIPESVTSIRNYAFNECTSLKELVIADGNETLSLGYNYSGGTGEGLFYDCPLETIYWGRNLSYDNDYQHGYSPFYDQKVLTSVTIGESVTSIKEWAFRDCNSLTSIIVEGGNTTYDSRDNCNAIIETSGNCLIVGCSTTIIPEGVTSIGMYAFYNCSNLTSITIPERVTSIGSYAFDGCSRLTAITISKSSQLTWIGKYAFYYCSRLTSITIPESVTSIGDFAFDRCTSLKELVIEDGSKTLSLGYNKYYDNVDYYGPGLFHNCPLETIYLGRNLSYDSGKSYGYSPFYNQKALTSVTIGESVTSIEDYAFYNCSSLTAITIPESVTSIGLYAFSGTAWYDNQPDGVIYINKVLYTYKGTMPANTSIEVKEGTEYIANRAFYGCSSLTSITIPESVTSIGTSVFYGCSSLTAVHIKDIASWCNISFGDSDSNPLYYAKNLYLNGELVTELTIPNTVTAIKSYAFYNCSNLTSITIPEGVTSIGSSAFSGCTSLTSITIPENSELRSIEKSAFSGCSRLTAIIIPEGVTSIGSSAFKGCTSLKELVIADGSKTLSLGYNYYNSSSNKIGEGLFYDCPLETIYLGRNLSYHSGKQYGYSPFYNQKALTSVTIGESVTSIGEYDFYDCSRLTAVHIKDIASWCNIDFDGYNANPLYYAKNLYLNGELVTELTIPNTVTAIKRYAFYNCRNLTSITIPENVTSIENYAFRGCTSLKELVIADGSETLSLGYNDYDYYGTGTGEGLFYDCPLETIYLGRNLSYDSIEKYGYSPFYNQKALTSVTIGESVTSIGRYAFYNCNSLNKVYIKDIEAWCNIKFGNINSNPLYYAHNLYLNGELVTELTIPNTVTAIKSYAFYNCSSLTSITIPENSQLTSIGWGAFSYCSRLTSITLSEGVTSIGDDSFSGCSNVENLVVKGSAMPYVPSDKLKKIVLYSPAPLQSKGFSSTVYQNCMLYVPQQGLARYQIVEPWVYFWNIIAFDTSDIAPAELPEDDSAPIIYDLRGQRVDVPTRGNIYIVNGRKVLY